jgi:long-chain acyl-CoA synthetase
MTRLAPDTSDVSTLADLPFYVATHFDKPAQLRRCVGNSRHDLSSRGLLERVRAVSLGLQSLGVHTGDRVGIVCESRPEWCVADLAILTARAITVPVYPTLSAAQTKFILEDAGISVVLVSDDVQLAKLREIAASCPALTVIVVVAPVEPIPPSAGPPLIVRSIDEVATDGLTRLQREPGLIDQFERLARGGQPSDVATFIYTSGTTGNPKGVVLTHHNILSNVRAANAVLGVVPDDLALSYLPLSHTFERLALYVFLIAGASVTFAESLQTVARDLQNVAPTIMTGVPRVYEKFHHAVLDNVAGAPPLRRLLFAWAMKVAYAISRARLDGRRPPVWAALQHPLADLLVLRKIRARTGGRLRTMVSGSAPLAHATAEFFFAVGMPIIEAYGLTETAPGLTINPLDAPRVGSAGKPIPGVDIRIAEDGEILVRGPNIMVGYYNRPDDTAAVLRDGWLHTGDIGHVDADGYLYITDRKKDLIVTSGGKNIAPAPIELRLKESPLVSEAIVIGDRRNFPAALLVPNFVVLEAQVREAGGLSGTREQLVRRADVVAIYQRLVDAINIDLAQFEKIKRFAVLPSEMTIEGGELTPTLKLRRSIVEQRCAAIIEQMYSNREPVTS